MPGCKGSNRTCTPPTQRARTDDPAAKSEFGDEWRTTRVEKAEKAINQFDSTNSLNSYDA
jgi:hypothetical protein